MLTGCKVLATLGSIDRAVSAVVPVADVDDVDHGSTFGVAQDGILHILGRTQGDSGVLARLLLPLGNAVEPELHEVERSGVLGTDQLHDVPVVREVVEALTDVLPVKLAAHGVSRVIELVGDEDALVSGKVDRFAHVGVVDVVGIAPGAVHPVGAGFKDIVLEVVLVEEQHARRFRLVGKRLQAEPVPGVGTRQVVLRQSVPSLPLARTAERLFIEGRPHIAVATADAFVVGAAQVVPESVVMVEHHVATTLHHDQCGVDAVGQSLRAGSGGDELQLCHIALFVGVRVGGIIHQLEIGRVLYNLSHPYAALGNRLAPGSGQGLLKGGLVLLGLKHYNFPPVGAVPSFGTGGVLVGNVL